MKETKVKTIFLGKIIRKKQEKIEKLKGQKGITLVALIVTIIVLLILAGVTIATLTGDNGILTNTMYAKFATEIRNLEEQVSNKTLTSDTPYFGTVNDLLNINSKYNDKLLVEEDELKYIPNNSSSREIEWFEKLGIEKISDYYTIEFIPYNGSETITQKVKAGNKVEQPDDPRKEGYDFLGWYYLKQSGSEENPTYEEIEFDFNTEILNDYTIYAKYSGEAVMRAYNPYSPFGFWQYKDKIKHISFEQGDIPNDLPELSWNVRENNNCTDIIAYLEGSEEDGYDLTIISTKTIYANANSGNYFNGFSELETINFDNFDTSKSITMGWMFNGCTSLKEINLDNFNTTNVNNMQRMFAFCNNLETLDLSSFNTNKVSIMYGMFWGCSSLYNLNINNFDTSNVISMGNMLNGCVSLTSLNISDFNTSNVTTMFEMFANCSKLQDLNLNNFNTSKVTTMQGMFKDCNNLTNLNISNFDTSNVTTMQEMFSGCNNLTNLNVSNFNTSNVTTMANMFYYCNNLQNLNLSNFNTSNVTTMQSMFCYCGKLQDLNLSNFNTSNVTTMANMFRQCRNLTSLNLSNFDTLNVTTMKDMFRYSSNLTTIYVKPFEESSNRGWNTNSIINTETMFLGCTRLIGGAGTKYNENNVDTNYAHIDQIGNPGYLTEYK